MNQLIGKIHKEDCLIFMKKLPSESIGLIVTSPPYNLIEGTGKGTGSRFKFKGYKDHVDQMPKHKYNVWQRDCLCEMMRIIKKDGAIFYNHKWRVQGGLIEDRSEILKDFPVRQIIIWQRSGGVNFTNTYFLPTYEVIYLICKLDFKLNKRANRYGDVWSIPQEKNTDHPAPFPLAIAERCIGSTSAEIVFDPFMGSGTTAIAAKKLNRKWVGTEISDQYIQIAENRIRKYESPGQVGELNLFGAPMKFNP